MALTPETLIRHELNGLRVEVVEATNPDLVGIAGRVVVETMRTFQVDTGSRVVQVPKRGATFEFRIPCTDEAAGSRRGDTDLGDSPTRRGREAPGTASELVPETAEDRGGTAADEPGQSGGAVERRSTGSREASGNCEDVAHVTVDGTQLLSRPALRTEDAGDSKWR
jgi:ribonuclease P protein subunit POP4